MPEILTIDEKAGRKNVSSDILNTIENDPKFLEEVITCDESWFFN